MAYILDLKTFSDERGNLTVIEKILPFDIKRVFYIYKVDDSLLRGSHCHKKTIQALICLQGSCLIYTTNAKEEQEFLLQTPDTCLILHPEDWHTMKFSTDAIVLVLASEYFDPDDYIAEKPRS